MLGDTTVAGDTTLNMPVTVVGALNARSDLRGEWRRCSSNGWLPTGGFCSMWHLNSWLQIASLPLAGPPHPSLFTAAAALSTPCAAAKSLTSAKCTCASKPLTG